MCPSAGSPNYTTIDLLILAFQPVGSPLLSRSYSGDPPDPSNCCLVSLLPLFSKIFKALISAEVVKYLTSHDLLSDKQYVFHLKAWSIADVLMAIIKYVYQALDNNSEAQAVALDISKAFDMDWHACLLRKLQGYGITGWLFDLIHSFLFNREIVLNGFSSSSFYMNAGVLQGSILGPTLFLISINDLPNIFSSQVGIYSDDTDLFLSQ